MALKTGGRADACGDILHREILRPSVERDGADADAAAAAAAEGWRRQLAEQAPRKRWRRLVSRAKSRKSAKVEGGDAV